MTKIVIKENSILAKLAAKKLRVNNVALTIGKTIYLHNATKQELLDNKKWLCHELTHVKQYQQLGKFRFIVLYITESIKKGYYNNKFEVEARQNECNEAVINDFEFD